jgi:hypothetical protein
VLPGSFMTGQIRWAVYGGIAIAAGITLLLLANRPRKGALIMGQLENFRPPVLRIRPLGFRSPPRPSCAYRRESCLTA